MALYSQAELLKLVGLRAKQRRLGLRFRQEDLARAAGVPVITLRRLEAGKSVGFERVILIAFALGAEAEFTTLFPPPEKRTLDDVLRAQREPMRARRRR